MEESLTLKNLQEPVRWPGADYEFPRVPDVVCMMPHLPRWYELRDYRERRENQNPKRAIHYGYLSTNSYWNMEAQNIGRQPKPLGCWHMYICRHCGRLFVSQQPPHRLRSDNCGCVAKVYGQVRQTMRLEGRQFGWLIAVEYRSADGRGTEGAWLCTCVGPNGECGTPCYVATQRLTKLRTLGCEKCCPEDWWVMAGRKPHDSMHYRALMDHHEREWESRSKSEKQPA